MNEYTLKVIKVSQSLSTILFNYVGNHSKCFDYGYFLIKVNISYLRIWLLLLKMDFSSELKNTYSIVLHSHTVLTKVCPCGRYRQLKSVLYPNKHILKSSKIISNWLFLKYV